MMPSIILRGLVTVKFKFGPFEFGLCRYEKCIFYSRKKHPKSGQTCMFGHPSCLIGKFDWFLSWNSLIYGSLLLGKWKSFICKLLGHKPYIIPAPPHVNPRPIVCRRCAKPLGGVRKRK